MKSIRDWSFFNGNSIYLLIILGIFERIARQEATAVAP